MGWKLMVTTLTTNFYKTLSWTRQDGSAPIFENPFRLKITQRRNLSNNTSDILVAVEGKRSSGGSYDEYFNMYSASTNGSGTLEVTINGTTFTGTTTNYRAYVSTFPQSDLAASAPAVPSNERLNSASPYTHSANGTKSLTISVKYSTCWKKPLLSSGYYQNVAEWSGTIALDSIDQTAPSVTFGTVSLNASRSTITLNNTSISHPSQYQVHITCVCTNDTTTDTKVIDWDSYTPRTVTNSVSVSGIFSPGATYYYTTTVACANGKTVTDSGSFIAYSKVTGITLGMQQLVVGQSQSLSISFQGENGTTPTVATYSATVSDTTIATYSNGTLTPVSEGTTSISIVSNDPYATVSTASALVIVASSSTFPEFPDEVDVLSVSLMNDIIRAIVILDTSEICDIPEFSGASQTVKSIQGVLNGIGDCIETLGGTRTSGVLPNSNTNRGWYTIVNNWIADLEDLHA